MILSMELQNFTAFTSAKLQFGKQLNVIVGEHGSGKSHLLKLLYSALAASWEEGRKPNAQPPTEARLQLALADKLLGVFRPGSLGQLVRQKTRGGRCQARLRFDRVGQDLAFGFSAQSKAEIELEAAPKQWLAAPPVFLPGRELLTLYPGFRSLNEGQQLEFEETWRDTCRLLGAPLLREDPKVESSSSICSSRLRS